MAVSSPLPLAPGATIGILGNGQLGRMLCLAAARLGYRSHVYGPEPDSPAQQVATYSTEAAYDNQAMLKTFADSVQVVTFEFENVPAQAASYLATHTAVRPSWRALDIAQDRTKEKTFFAEIGAATPPWRAVDSLAELEAAISHMGTPAILKTSRLGYDGKGQAKISKPGDAKSAWTAIGGARAPASGNFAILEGFVDFSKEISVIAARGHDGATICFEPSHNVHANHILSTATVPADISPALSQTAIDIAIRAVTALDLVGLLAVEMFVGNDGKLLCNEMAPRPHNSGHWTMDTGGCDQFEMLVRAVTGLPLVPPARTADVTMINLIGDDVKNMERYYTDPAARIHLYGKAEARPGRKIGHVNIATPKRS